MPRCSMRIALVMLLVACSTRPIDTDSTDVGSTEALDRTVSLDRPERGYQVVTPPFTVPAFAEVELCTVVELEPHADETLVWFDTLESMSAPGTHHMNVFIGQFSFLDAFVADGASQAALGTDAIQLPCDDIELMSQAFPVFPSQRENQRITLPDGVAAPMPLPIVMVFSHHYVNTGSRPVTINAALNMETVPVEEVETTASLLFNAIGGLDLQPGTRRSYARTCIAERDVSVALVSTHTHEWASCTTLNHYDGVEDAVEREPFYVNQNWDRPPILHFEPGTMDLRSGDGIHWACHYDNPGDEVIIDDGTAQGEMCVFAAVTWPASRTIEEITEVVDKRDLVEMMALLDDVLGPCDTVSEEPVGPWDLEVGTLGAEPVCAGLVDTESNTLD